MRNLWRECSVFIAFAILSVYFYFLMEWIFFATKPSFMSSLPMPEKISALLIPPCLFSLASIISIALIYGVARAIAAVTRIKLFEALAPLVPALPLAACVFILVDNFSYTLLDYGVISSAGWPRFLYCLWFLLLLSFSYVFFSRKARRPTSPNSRAALAAFAGLLILLSAVEGVRAIAQNARLTRAAIAAQSQLSRLPNILLISSDGINARNVSAYGYGRDTTPFLRAKMSDALVFENAFTNASSTRPSLASMLTGKSSATTRLFTISGILQGEHAYQHLPGILKSLGYRSMDIIFHYVGGSFDYNLRNSFDVSDSRAVRWRKFTLPEPLSSLFSNAEYMIGESVDRIRARLLHVFFVERMVDQFEELTHAKKEFFRASADADRLTALFAFIETADEPFFVHVHFMVTHGPQFPIDAPTFSKGQEQIEEWMDDFYDDSILQFDGYLAETFRRLEQSGKRENSIIVINTDHAKGREHSRTHERLPLLMFFPNQDPKGRIRSNVQLLDLAPTLLDYLGVDKPSWMEGDSVLRGEPDRMRRIVSVYAGRDPTTPGANIYEVQVVICDRIYNMLFPSQDVGLRLVDGHTNPCSDDEIPTREEVGEFIRGYLQSRGIDLALDTRRAE